MLIEDAKRGGALVPASPRPSLFSSANDSGSDDRLRGGSPGTNVVIELLLVVRVTFGRAACLDDVVDGEERVVVSVFDSGWDDIGCTCCCDCAEPWLSCARPFRVWTRHCCCKTLSSSLRLFFSSATSSSWLRVADNETGDEIQKPG